MKAFNEIHDEQIPPVDEHENKQLKRQWNHCRRQHHHTHRHEHGANDHIDDQKRQVEQKGYLKRRFHLADHKRAHHDRERNIVEALRVWHISDA